MVYKLRIFAIFTVSALFASALMGCASVKTAGVYNNNLSKKKPYVFSYEGTVDEASAQLKKVLLPKGFSTVSEDKYEGGATLSFEKTLSEDEKFETTALYEGYTGASTGKQSGRLVFVISNKSDGNARVKMTPRMITTLQQKEQETGLKASSDTKEAQVVRGHPLPMKYGRIFAKQNGWKLKSPPRKKVFTSSNR